MNLWFVFLTGLTTGGLSCLAMQGGLLTGVIANQKERENIQNVRNLDKISYSDWMPVGVFLISKLIVHTIFGFLLGLLGSSVALSLNLRLAFQTFTALFMFATAMNLLDTHPIFRYMAFQPPKFVQRWVRKSSKSNTLFAPAILGLVTLLVPCGVTQAMEILAINTGNPLQGALILFAFVSGTFPLFALIGIGTSKLSVGLKGNFMKFAAFILISISLYTFNSVLIVLDAPVTWQKFYNSFFGPPAYLTVNNNYVNNTQENNLQRVTINILPQGYNPKNFTVKAGVPVELLLKSNNTYTCALSFTFREFGISEVLKPTDSRTIKFTPTKPGRYMFSCSMGMYVGYMNVE